MIRRMWLQQPEGPLVKGIALFLAISLSLIIGLWVRGTGVTHSMERAPLEEVGAMQENEEDKSSQMTLNDSEVQLLARMIAAEAEGEPYRGKVAVGAVILNRMGSSLFPDSLRGVLFEPRQFQPVRNGRFWRVPVGEVHRQAAREALGGEDPTGGATFFFAPAKTNDSFMWSRPVIMDIGNHRFTR